MSPSPPFVDPGTGSLDIDRILAEAAPLARLIALFGAVALVPLAIAFFLGGRSPVGAVMALVAQFVLAVGAGIVMIHVVARGIQLADG